MAYPLVLLTFALFLRDRFFDDSSVEEVNGAVGMTGEAGVVDHVGKGLRNKGLRFKSEDGWMVASEF